MNEQVKKEWDTWLRSGQYDQLQGALCAETDSGRTAFCCMGMLCNIHAEESKTLHWEEEKVCGARFAKKNGKSRTIRARELSYLGNLETIPESVRNWAGLTQNQESTLIGMNDSGASFEKIADFIGEKF